MGRVLGLVLCLFLFALPAHAEEPKGGGYRFNCESVDAWLGHVQAAGYRAVRGSLATSLAWRPTMAVHEVALRPFDFTLNFELFGQTVLLQVSARGIAELAGALVCVVRDG